MRRILALIFAAAIALASIAPAFAAVPPGQRGYEGQPGNQGAHQHPGLQGYEGQPGNQGG
jgi:regulator of protease activity HflC (stomatin/prohibitin superfamily)